MAERKSFLLRIDADVLDALRRWAGDDLRSLNAQIEFVLRHALRGEGRLRDSRDVEQASRPIPEPPAPPAEC